MYGGHVLKCEDKSHVHTFYYRHGFYTLSMPIEAVSTCPISDRNIINVPSCPHIKYYRIKCHHLLIYFNTLYMFQYTSSIWKVFK